MLLSVLCLSERFKAPPSTSEGLSIEDLKEQVGLAFGAPDIRDVACSQQLNTSVCQGNLAFKRAALLKSHCRFFWHWQLCHEYLGLARRTTASTQYLSEAKSYYIQASSSHPRRSGIGKRPAS